MLCSLNDLKIYKSYYDNILNGNIIPYDEKVIMKLMSHKNKQDENMQSYLKTLLTNSACTSYLKCRYLKQYLSDDFTICDGLLTNFEGKVYHSWLENDNSVYDTLFIGKWPKELYYEILGAKVGKRIDTNKDEEYKRLVDKTIEIEPSSQEFGYMDWYHYMKNNSIGTKAFIEPLRLRKFNNE